MSYWQLDQERIESELDNLRGEMHIDGLTDGLNGKKAQYPNNSTYMAGWNSGITNYQPKQELPLEWSLCGDDF